MSMTETGVVDVAKDQSSAGERFIPFIDVSYDASQPPK